MTKGKQKSNRELKKPKTDKNKPTSGNTPGPSAKVKISEVAPALRKN